MKTLIFLLTMPLLSFTLKSDLLNSCKGFEKFTFGAPKNAFKKLVPEAAESDSNTYMVDPKEVSIPGVEFESIKVSFIKNKLSSVSILTKNSTRGVFFQFLKEHYGIPSKTSRTYEWVGKDVQIIYEPCQNSREAVIDFYSSVH